MKVIIGIDVSKDKLDIFNLETQKHEVIANNVKQINSYLRKLAKMEQEFHLVLENTGGYERKLIECSSKYENIETTKASSSKIHYFAKYKGILAKTDKLDAKTIALYAKENQIAADEKYDKTQEILKDMQTRRLQITDALKKERTRMKQDWHSLEVKKSMRAQIKFLEKQVEGIQKEIEKILQTALEKQSQMKCMQSMPGVGPKISQGIVIMVPEIGKIDRNEIAALLGVAPVNKDSGRRVGRRAIHGGRLEVRNLLYMGAVTASRSNPKYRKTYENLIAKGKKPKVALVAVMRKMIITLNAMVRDNKDWKYA